MKRHGTCRWCGAPDTQDLKDGTALLEITTSKGVTGGYWVFCSKTDTRIKNMRTDEVYAVNLETGWCECPDHQKRKTECKHVRALRAALPKVKQAPKQQGKK